MNFEHSIRASAPTSIGAPNNAEIKAINDRIALVPQSADDLFVWSFTISNNHVDSHATWMDRSSLENYARQANTGRGVPYLRHHNTEVDERGRVFRGSLTRGEVQERADKKTPLARDLYRRAERDLQLVETAFMRRGLVMGGVSNDDLIASIEAGIAASNSIGFSVYTPTAPDSYLECDICGVDLFATDDEGAFVCGHLPGIEYAVRADDHAHSRCVATARVVNATQREASGVYLGSTPGTYTLANRANALYTAGRVSEADARHLEDMLSLERGVVTLGRPQTAYSIPTPTKTATAARDVPDGPRGNGAISNPSDPIGVTTMTDNEYDAVARVREVLKDDPDRTAAVELSDVSLTADPVGALHAAMTEAFEEMRDERDEAVTAYAEFRRGLRERLGVGEGEDTAAGIERLLADAAVAREYRGELVAEMLRQMTRAGLAYDEDVQKALAERLTPAQLRAQADMYREAANKALAPGRISEPEIETRKPKALPRVGYAG